MKIDPGNEIISYVSPQKDVNNKNPVDKEFGTIFKERIESHSGLDHATQKTWTINVVPEIRPNILAPDEKALIISRVDSFLDIMSKYRQDLENTQVDIKDIYPLVNKMKEERESLVPVLNSLPDGDGLKDILNQALIISSLEIIKFTRDDYLPDHE